MSNQPTTTLARLQQTTYKVLGTSYVAPHLVSPTTEQPNLGYFTQFSHTAPPYKHQCRLYQGRWYFTGGGYQA